MVNAQFSKHVASLETREGCPITPGANFTKTFFLVPLASSNKDRRGIFFTPKIYFLIKKKFQLIFSHGNDRNCS